MAVVSPEGVRYYASPDVQQRVREYCGDVDGRLTCHFVSSLPAGGFATWDNAPRAAPEQLHRLFETGWDISRSLCDRESLIVYFELDVADADAPQDALLRPAQAFFDLEPVYRAVCLELRRLDLSLLDVMTGRGYHFAGRVPLGHDVVAWIAGLAPRDAARAERTHIGLGMVLEYLAHQIYRRVGAHHVPVVFDGVEVGRGGAGREAVSLDLSCYGDPAHVRQMRAAFSTYQSHRVRPDIFGGRALHDVPVLAAVPRRGRSLFWMLEHARTAEQAAALAPGEESRIPEVSAGLAGLAREYQRSRLATFHRAFYDEAFVHPALEIETLPPCIAQGLRCPNDALLKPTVLQQVTRYLLSEGWSARQVASLVWSKYATQAHWGERWQRLSARRRAEFDVRVFAGALIEGLDRALDFNCVSSQEKGLCPRVECTHDLRDQRRQLLQRIAV